MICTGHFTYQGYLPSSLWTFIFCCSWRYT